MIRYDNMKLKKPHTAHYLSFCVPLCYDHYNIDHVVGHDGDGHDDEHHDDDYVVRHDDDDDGGEDDHLASAVVDQSVADTTRLLRLSSLNF